MTNAYRAGWRESMTTAQSELASAGAWSEEAGEGSGTMVRVQLRAWKGVPAMVGAGSLILLAAASALAAPQQPTVATKGIATIADAIEALNGQRAPDPSSPVPIGNPGQWFGAGDYPMAARRAGEQGRVVAMVAVDASGHVTGCTITGSSGSATLDAATCKIAQAKMTFKPALDASGHTVAGQYRLPVVWRLPVDAAAVLAAMLVTTLVSVGPDGEILSCTSQSAAHLPDLCGAFPKGQKVAGLDAMRGKVVQMATFVRPLAE